MGASGEDARLELLLKMVRKRREVSAPDVDAEWADFKLRHIVKEVQEERIHPKIIHSCGILGIKVWVYKGEILEKKTPRRKEGNE